MPDMQDPFRGCLLGLAIGDALGATYEGESRSFISSRFPSPQALLDRDLGTLQYTDDTQMTIGVAEALLEDGEIRVATLCRNFVDNYVPARGYGRGARQILDAMEEGRDYVAVAEEIFPGGSYGNGAAMRVAPLGLYFSKDAQKLAEQVVLQSEVTHRHPLGIEGAQIIASAVAAVIGADQLDQKEFLSRIRPACTQPEFVNRWDRLPYLGPPHIGELGNGIEAAESVMTAVACFLAWPGSYVDAIGNAILLGGDTDTIAAMTGAISGAYLGIEAIPPATLAKLENHGQGRDYLFALADRLFEHWQSNS
jgi:poly(ADP-ribose) glycohydrolase ARH3